MLLSCALLCVEPAAASAEAAPGAVQLSWRVPEGSGCATEDEMRLQVERLSERAPFVAAGLRADHTIAGEIEAYETTWRARIMLRDAAGKELGQREVIGRSPTCRTLNVPVALVIVTLADSLLEAPPPTTVESAAPPAPRLKPVVQKPALAPQPPHEASTALALGLGVFGALDLSLLPSATAGIGAALEARLPLPVALEAALYAPVDDLDAQGRGARLVLWHFGAAVCPELRLSRGGPLRAQLCAAGQIGAIDAAGRGLTEATSAQRMVAVLGFEPKLVWFLGRSFTARASILAGWVLAQPSFRVDIEGQAPRIVRSDPVALQLRLGFMGFAL